MGSRLKSSPNSVRLSSLPQSVHEFHKFPAKNPGLLHLDHVISIISSLWILPQGPQGGVCDENRLIVITANNHVGRGLPGCGPWILLTKRLPNQTWLSPPPNLVFILLHSLGLSALTRWFSMIQQAMLHNFIPSIRDRSLTKINSAICVGIVINLLNLGKSAGFCHSCFI